MANYGYVTALGVVVPDTGELLTTVEGEWREAFGVDLVTTPETPQGVLIAAEVEARDAVVRNNVDLANQINPDIAGGIFLDGIWSLTRGKRRPAVRSVIPGAVLGGQPATIILAGSLAAVEGSGDLFRTKSTVVIAATGSISVDLESVDFGPIPAAIGQLVNVATSVLGWETITNPTAAALGALQESDVAARSRRKRTLALQGVALPEAITSWLNDIDSVHSLTFRENVTNVATVIDGVLLGPHSIYVCVHGGTDAEIGEVLLSAKSAGAGWNGTQTVNMLEPFSGQTYLVRFDRAIEVPVFVRVTAKFNNLDGAQIIPNAILTYAAGELEGEDGFITGASVEPFELSGAVNQVEPRIVVRNVELSTDGINYAAAAVPISIQQIATVTFASITVVPA